MKGGVLRLNLPGEGANVIFASSARGDRFRGVSGRMYRYFAACKMESSCGSLTAVGPRFLACRI